MLMIERRDVTRVPSSQLIHTGPAACGSGATLTGSCLLGASGTLQKGNTSSCTHSS